MSRPDGSSSLFVPLGGLTRARVVDENPAHRLRRNPKEVTPVLPLDTTLIDELEIGLVHEGGRRNGVIRALSPQVRFRELFELAVQDLDQLTLRNPVALTPGDQ
jgi:hypothetical protein